MIDGRFRPNEMNTTHPNIMYSTNALCMNAIRYLVPFHPKSVPHFFTDVLVIGSGLAAMRAALAIDPGLTVVMITKDGVGQSNSNVAQGGIAGVLDPADRFENHVR